MNQSMDKDMESDSGPGADSSGALGSDDTLSITCIQYADEDGSGSCSKCGSQCLDRSVDPCGITLDGKPICSACA